MSDVRALLAAERQSRRISHPHLSYTKSGALLCNVCNLNVKSETLWEGHLRSANHRKNLQKAQESSTRSLKRKIENVDTSSEESVQRTGDGRKKTKSRLEPVAEESDSAISSESLKEAETVDAAHPTPIETTVVPERPITNTLTTNGVQQSEAPVPVAVDEDEWAAFERDVAPLTKPDYSAATISAAPMTAAQITAQAEEDKRQRQDLEAEDEKEEEERRMEEEFDIMEEMEERVRKLREKREALRRNVAVDNGRELEPNPGEEEIELKTATEDQGIVAKQSEDEDSEDDDEVDDWYS